MGDMGVSVRQKHLHDERDRNLPRGKVERHVGNSAEERGGRVPAGGGRRGVGGGRRGVGGGRGW